MAKAPGKRSGYGLVMGLLLGGEFITAGGPALGQTGVEVGNEQQPSISVHVYNYAQFSYTLLREAEDEAAGIFHAAGVEIAWTNCNPAITDLPNVSRCAQFLDPVDLRVRLLPDIGTPPGSRRRPMGTAIGNLASVSLCRVRDDATESRVMPQVVLGPVLAHEIGHLLLGPGGHSARGIMRPCWRPEDYKPPLLRTLSFTPEQPRSISAELRKRVQKQVVAAPLTATASH